MPPKRIQIAAACAECQRAKAKCDGARPECSRCRARGITCYYDVEPGTTRAVAQKRKRVELQNGVDDLLELYEYLRTRPDAEVIEIVRRIRATEDPFSVVRLVRQGDILLQRRLTSPSAEPILRRLDADALQHSHIKVPARPWTSVAGDGIVSHLISMYFGRERHFSMPFIHERAFLKDMTSADPAAAYFCSPMLVNAICAMGAFASSYAQAVDATSGRRLREQFYNEAKKLFDKEAGKASLTTAQALFFLYMYSTSAAMDRAGLVFRLAGCEMFKRLKLGSKIPSKLQRANDEMYSEAVSRSAWGMFYTETLVSFAYLQASLIPPPTIPRYFMSSSSGSNGGNHAPLGTSGVLDAQSDGADIFYRIASYQPAEPGNLGSAADIEERQRLYNMISDWYNALPPRTSYVPSQFRQWFYLRCHYHFGAIALYRPLQDVDKEVSSFLGTPANICITHCVLMVHELEASRDFSPSDFTHGSIEAMNFFYTCLFTLITMLGKDPRCYEPFTKCLRFFYNISQHWPAAEAVLHGVRAMSRQLALELPSDSMQYITTSRNIHDGQDDLPISWVIPPHGEMLELLSENGLSDTEHIGVELGTIISKWNAMSIDA